MRIDLKFALKQFGFDTPNPVRTQAQSNATAAGLCDLQSVVPDSPGRPGQACHAAG